MTKRIVCILLTLFTVLSVFTACGNGSGNNAVHTPSQDSAAKKEQDIKTAEYFMNWYCNDAFANTKTLFDNAVYSDSMTEEVIGYASVFLARAEVKSAVQTVYNFEKDAPVAFALVKESNGSYWFEDTVAGEKLKRVITYNYEGSSMIIEQYTAEGKLKWVYEMVKPITGDGFAVQYNVVNTAGKWTAWQLLSDSNGTKIALKGPFDNCASSIFEGVLSEGFAE